MRSCHRLLGAVVDTDGKPYRDADGFTIYRAAPLLDREVYEAVQARLELNVSPVRINTSPLLQVAFCVCGAPMHSTVTTREHYTYRYYQCHKSHHRDGNCRAKLVRAEPVEEAVFGALLEFAGDAYLTERKLIPGRDYSEEIARVGEQIGHLSSVVAVGQATGKDVSQEAETLARAQAEIRRLAALEPVPARIEPIATDKRFREHWESLDTVGRNRFLRDAGVRTVISKEGLPPLGTSAGPMTPLEIPRTVIVQRDGMHAVIDFGGLGDLLRRASAA